MLKSSLNNKKGMIFPMIIMMVLIFVTFLIVLQNFNVRNRKINYRDVMMRQSRYVAEAGMQHALLKLKVHSTDCFDALMISQLKNPGFNFALALKNDGKVDKNDIEVNPRSPNYNPGPIYITTSKAEREKMLKDPKYIGDPSVDDISGELNIFIRDFIKDIKFDDIKKVSVTDKKTIEFKYGYKARSVKILGEKWEHSGGKTIGYLSAEFIIDGYAYDKDGKKVTSTIKRVYKIKKQY